MAHDKAVKAAYVGWWLTPAGERPSRTKWCDENGVNESTCIRWEKAPWFEDLCTEIQTELQLTPDRIQAVVDALQKKASDGDPRAADLYLKYVERMKPPKVEERDSSTWTDEEYRELLLDELVAVEARINDAQSEPSGAALPQLAPTV